MLLQCAQQRHHCRAVLLDVSPVLVEEMHAPREIEF
jgi:hypothetical protein